MRIIPAIIKRRIQLIISILIIQLNLDLIRRQQTIHILPMLRRTINPRPILIHRMKLQIRQLLLLNLTLIKLTLRIITIRKKSIIISFFEFFFEIHSGVFVVFHDGHWKVVG